MQVFACFCLENNSLLAKKKFRGKGNKDAAVIAFKELHKVGLGELICEGSTRGTSEVGGVCAK